VISAAAWVDADLGSVETLRWALARVLEIKGWTGEHAARVLTATGEALANAMLHGSQDGGELSLAFTVGPHEVRVAVRDEGRPGVVAPRCEPPLPPETSPRGRGRLLIRALADHVEVRRRDAGTEIVMSFVRVPEAA
jgi:anti-sigma regulatory factor (Ser/Thr protein kinase)